MKREGKELHLQKCVITTHHTAQGNTDDDERTIIHCCIQGIITLIIIDSYRIFKA